MCNGWKLLTIVTKSSIFNLARFPDLPLKKNKKKTKKKQKNKKKKTKKQQNTQPKKKKKKKTPTKKKKIKDTLLAEKNDSLYRDT